MFVVCQPCLGGQSPAGVSAGLSTAGDSDILVMVCPESAPAYHTTKFPQVLQRCDPLTQTAVNVRSVLDMAVGQNQWYHFGVGAPPMLVYFSGGTGF